MIGPWPPNTGNGDASGVNLAQLWQMIAPGSDAPPAWMDQILQTMQLQSPDYSRISPRNLPLAPNRLLTAGAFPAVPAVGAAQQSGGTGPTVTATPQATSASGATGSTQPSGTSPTLNPQTIQQVWNTMLQQGTESGTSGGTSGGTSEFSGSTAESPSGPSTS